VKGVFWAALGFVLGSMPFSFWLGRLFAQADIRHCGDGNPGAANACGAFHTDGSAFPSIWRFSIRSACCW
jgi:glycerol-3-phosphate acyltransferase PlsY